MTWLTTTKKNTINKGIMAKLTARPSFLSLGLSAADANSFWIKRLNRTRIPIRAKEPAMVMVETVDVVTVEIIQK